MAPAITLSAADMEGLTVPIRKIAVTVAMHGGKTFQTNMFSTVKTAFEVAVIRLVSMPGSRSEKQLGAWPVRWRKMSRRRSPVTPTNVKLAVQLAIRHKKLSAAISDMRKTNASHTVPARLAPADKPSTRYFTPYCVPTEQATAATTLVTITRCDARRWRR